MLTEPVQVPWLAESEEGTYMNKLKEKNEEPVKSYKDLILSSITQFFYEPEGFGDGIGNLLFKILLIIFLLCVICYLVKNY